MTLQNFSSISMYIRVLVVIFISTVVVFADAEKKQGGVNWAVLVAGSNGYDNYRHQADVCHAYQILHKNGIPDERIIVMMYDDIADSDDNPNRGKIINRPFGPDVYHEVLKDYTKHSVTPGHFLDVLQGKKTYKTPKVLESGPNDNVFVYFADHGAPGLVAFPGIETLHAKKLNQTISKMYEDRKFKNMIIYMESCESGSMFSSILPNDMNIYVTTAANTNESSYACYFDDNLGVFLGDLYSVSWLEDADKGLIGNETLFSQFTRVKQLTNMSHVEEYGNLTMSKTMFVGDFIADMNRNVSDSNNSIEPFDDTLSEPVAKNDAIKSEDVRHKTLKLKLRTEKDPKKRMALIAKLDNVLKLRLIAKKTIRSLVTRIVEQENYNANNSNSNRIDINQIFERANTKNITQFDCYQESVDHLIERCFRKDENYYALRHLYLVLNLCEHGVRQEKIIKESNLICHE